MKQSNPSLFNIMKSVAWLVLLAAALNFSSCSSSEDEETYLGDWYEKSTFEGVARSGAVAFVIDNKTYVGTGYDGSKWLKDFWMYDASRDTWVRKADFPGTARSGAVAFTANGKGYVGTGQNGVNYYKDFYSYDPATDTWSAAQEVADFTGTSRYGAIAFEINGKGYIGAGYDGNYLKDIWQYNPDNNQWTQKVSIGGNKRNNAFAFVINNKAYVGGGKNNGTLVQDFWEYDAEADAWTSKTDLDDEDLDYDSHTISRELASTFVINGYGYIVGGTTGGISAEVWQYDPTNDLWEQKTSFEGYARESAIGFAIGNMGYYATGRSSSLRFDDIWQFDPTAVDVDD